MIWRMTIILHSTRWRIRHVLVFKYVKTVDGVALWGVTHRALLITLFLVSVITHRHLCPRHCDHSQCLSLSLIAFSRRLASLSRGLWHHSLCLVCVPYIRTRTSPSHSRAPRSLALSSAVALNVSSLASPLSPSLRRGSARLQDAH